MTLAVRDATADAHAALETYRGKLFLKISEVASILGADPRTISRAIEAGQIQSVRISDATIRVPAAPFWRDVAALGPMTLRFLGFTPESDQAGRDEDSEPDPSTTDGSGSNDGPAPTGSHLHHGQASPPTPSNIRQLSGL